MRMLYQVTIGALLLGLCVTSPALAQATATPSGNQWIASGFVGSNFGTNAATASTEFGGSVGYLWRGELGAEFNAGFTPNFSLQNNFFGLGVTPQVNNYTGNLIAALPLGPDGRWQPFVSGGVGAISLRSTFGNADRLGGDIGAGLMGFIGAWGFKADVRYLRASGAYSTSASGTYLTPTPFAPTPTTSGLADSALSGLAFWRANVGVAVRW